MNSLDFKSKLTFLSGRPSTGKTNLAIELCSNLLSKNWKIIYYHAEGAIDASPSAYGARNPDQLQNINLITDLYFDLDELRALMDRSFVLESAEGLLVVIDYLELFDCEPHDLFHLIGESQNTRNLKFLILTQLPRYLERKTKDHAEEYIRNTYPTNVENQIKILGKFAGDD
ncbi:hypothetical protein K2P97_00295 [bacterium]|nr:hypothetical protein [bacterium]